MTTYQSPGILFNRHAETIFPSLFRQVRIPPYERERINTPDDDFLDLDWLRGGSQSLVILSHGLEGNSSRPYIKGMARAFYENKYDVLAWNYRGCSEEMNRQLRFYHSGATDDLDTVIRHGNTNYDSVFLIGFSLGGNLTLKYLGEHGTQQSPTLKGAVAFSVPLDLHSSCIQISKKENWIYSQRFLRSLKEKVARKAEANPTLKTDGLEGIKTLIDFDHRFTSVLHGFDDAIDYYTKCSSIHFLNKISAPTLIVSSKNDPFLGRNCFPLAPAENNRVVVEYPERGGHVGFTLFNQNGLYWSEIRALEFIESCK
jgi:uncharacterized protein